MTTNLTATQIAKVGGQARIDASIDFANTIAAGMIAQGVDVTTAKHMACTFATNLLLRQHAAAAKMITDAQARIAA